MTPYLIAHVVRSEPAFDIAIKAEDMGTDSDPGPWWIMPSTGHRCYPYWNISFAEIDTTQTGCVFASCPDTPPEDWPDFCHYTLAPASNPEKGLELLAQLGLLKPKVPIKRRI